MYKYLLNILCFLLVLYFISNSATAKVYNTLLTNDDNSKFKLITYDDSLASDIYTQKIKLSKDILLIRQYGAIYLLKFDDRKIINSFYMNLDDFIMHYQNASITDNGTNITISIPRSWKKQYPLITHDFIISKDLDKIITPLVVQNPNVDYKNNLYEAWFIYPFSQGNDNYFLTSRRPYSSSICGFIYIEREPIYLYKENKNNNTFEYQDFLLSVKCNSKEKIIEGKDETIIQFYKNKNDVMIKDGKVKYMSLRSFLNHAYQSVFSEKPSRRIVKKSYADIKGYTELSENSDNYKKIKIWGFPIVVKQFKDKHNNKYYVTRYSKNSDRYSIIKINSNNTLAWITTTNVDLSKIITIDEKNIVLSIEGIKCRISQETPLSMQLIKQLEQIRIPGTFVQELLWNTIKYNNTPVIINNYLK